MENKDQFWSGRTAFIMAAVGSAVGLGNLWRFPYIAYNNGGGAFLIPWIIALITAGIPLMRLEFALGYHFRSGAPKAFHSLKKKYSWIGWGTLLVGFVIVCYYAVVMSWSMIYLVDSFNVTWGDNAADFFYKDVLSLSDNVGQIGGIQWTVFLGLVITWVLIYFIIFKGPEIVSKVVMWTVPLPIVLILVFIVRGLTLPGALEGLKFYLRPDFSKLLDISVWRAAYGQIFFSLSLAFGIMIAYARYQAPEEAEINNNARIISITNCLISFIAGFAVFTVIGYLAVSTGQNVGDLSIKGPGLAFITYPTAIQSMPYGASVFGVFFFIMLLTLGIDSAFSLVEAVATGLMDYIKSSKETLSFFVCLAGFLGGIIFATKAGLYWLDIVDHFANILLVLFGLLECIAVGWHISRNKEHILNIGAGEVREYANTYSKFSISRWWDFCVSILTPAALIFLLIRTLTDSIKTPYEDYPGWALWAGGWGLIILLVLIAVLLGRSTKPKS